MLDDHQKIPVSKDDLKKHFNEQLHFLEKSATSFDEGDESEAKRLATHLRVLLHDTKQSTSLLFQLGMKDLKFLDSASAYDPNNKVAHSGLISFIVGGSSRYVAMLDESPDKNREIDFNEWWNNPVFVDNSKRSLSRRDLILIAANQDGGTHVDPRIDEVYATLSKAGGLGWRAKNNKEDKFIEGPERAAIRQIAHEVLKTIIPGYFKKQKNIDGMIFSGVKVTKVIPDKIKNMPQMIHKKKIGRNDHCFCGSGVKFKKCHGR